MIVSNSVSPWWNRLESVLFGRGELAWLLLEPDTGLDHCPRILLSCFRGRTSDVHAPFFVFAFPELTRSFKGNNSTQGGSGGRRAIRTVFNFPSHLQSPSKRIVSFLNLAALYWVGPVRPIFPFPVRPPMSPPENANNHSRKIKAHSRNTRQPFRGTLLEGHANWRAEEALFI